MQTRLLLACILSYTCCFCQQYPFVHYTPKDGLVNSRVRKAYQDSKGRMYFITYGGLSVYDGARFTNYTTHNGLISDNVNDVLEVGDDSLLVAINSSGLNVLVKGHMKKFVFKTQVAPPVINHFLQDANGDVFLSADEGLYVLRKDSLTRLSTVLPGTNEEIVFLGSISSYKNFIIFTTNDLRDHRGVFLYDKSSGRIVDAMNELAASYLQRDRTGNYWIATFNQIQNLDTTALMQGKLVLHEPYFGKDSRLSGHIDFNSQNEVLIAPDGKQIIRFGRDGKTVVIESPDPIGSGTQNFFIDREDILWICHENGVYKLPNTNLQIKQSFAAGNTSGIRFTRVFDQHTLCIIMNNGEWRITTPSGTKLLTAPPSISLTPVHFSKTTIYAVAGNALYKALIPQSSSGSLHFRKILNVADSAGFGGESVMDPYGNLILFENTNLMVLSQDKKIFSYPLPFYDLIQGLYIDKDKQLWTISRNNKLEIFSIHPENPSDYLHRELQFVKEFGDASPRCVVVDKQGVLWIGTRYHGLLAFEYKNKTLRRLQHFKTENGLTDNFVISVACDANDNIIIGTQTGLDRLIKTSSSHYRVENITRSNNIFTYINYVWTDPQNNAFAQTNSGVVYQVEPVRASVVLAEPQLFIEEMKVNGQPISPSSSMPSLTYFQRNINVSVAAPTFMDEKQVQFSYLLEGSGIKEWSDTSAIADITLLNLAPGNYTLHVKAFFLSTSYAPKETSFSFVIRPPWWQTWWFRIIAGVLFIAVLVILTRYYYLRKLERQRNILEKKQAIEKERTRIATDMHDDLGAGLSRIKFLSETIGMKKQRHEPIEEDISKIREYSHEMIDKMGEIVWALNEKNDSLSDLLSYTRSYAVEYLSQNGIDCRVSLPEDLPSSFVSGEFRRNIFLAVKEILHNVVKHAQANRVDISIETTRRLSLRIHDDGIGFDPLHTRPYSNGLMNIKKRIADISGTVEIQSGKGTTITLSAPMTY